MWRRAYYVACLVQSTSPSTASSLATLERARTVLIYDSLCPVLRVVLLPGDNLLTSISCAKHLTLNVLFFTA